MEAPFTKEEIEQKSAEFIIKVIETLEYHHPMLWNSIIFNIQAGVY